MKNQIKTNLLRLSAIIVFFFIYIYLYDLILFITVNSFVRSCLRITIFNIYAITFGILLGTEGFFSQKKTQGSWIVNKPRILLIALPLLLFTILIWIENLLVIINPETYIQVPVFYSNIRNAFLMKHQIILLLIPLSAGFAFITSFDKKQVDE